MQVTLGPWPTPALAAPLMRVTTTAPLVCVNTRGCAGPRTTQSLKLPCSKWQIGSQPSQSPLGMSPASPSLRSVLTTYSADNCSGSTEGLVDSAGTGDLSYTYQGEWARQGQVAWCRAGAGWVKPDGRLPLLPDTGTGKDLLSSNPHPPLPFLLGPTSLVTFPFL